MQIQITQEHINTEIVCNSIIIQAIKQDTGLDIALGTRDVLLMPKYISIAKHNLPILINKPFSFDLPIPKEYYKECNL